MIAFPALDRTPAGIATSTAVLGIAAWMVTAPQQHQLIRLDPDHAGVVLVLNQSALYLGVGLAGPLGAVNLRLTHGPFAGVLPTPAVLAAVAVTTLSKP
jgi:predicted MFS family arabinose efflux permease